jgi:hypothetical protein
MQLSIREASQFVIGAAIMRSKAIELSGNSDITFDHIAIAALREGSDGEKLRLSIETLANQESALMRNTPPHTLKTERVMQSRSTEIRTFSAISDAVITTVELADSANSGNKEAHKTINDKYIAAFRAIDETPGSTQERRQLKAYLRDQAMTVSTEKEFVSTTLKSAETSYLEADAEAILSRYDILDRSSNDFDM